MLNNIVYIIVYYCTLQTIRSSAAFQTAHEIAKICDLEYRFSHF